MNDSAESPDAYQALMALNEGFAQVLDALTQMEQTRLRQARPLLFEGLRLTIEEARAWANFELMGVLSEEAASAWAHFGRVRRDWEQKYSQGA